MAASMGREEYVAASPVLEMADGWDRQPDGGWAKGFSLGGSFVSVRVPADAPDLESLLRQINARMAVLSDGIPDRNVLLAALSDNKALCENLTHTVNRCSELLEYGRRARALLIQAGGEDPGSPSPRTT